MSSAYRAAYSTETTLVKIVDDILPSVNSGSIVALIVLEFSAAFNTMNHVTLLARFQSEFGFTDAPLSSIESFLSGRSFFVHVGLSSAPVTQANSGVPQGSILGSILFTTYVAPIGRLINSYSINHHKYVDDTQL